MRRRHNVKTFRLERAKKHMLGSEIGPVWLSLKNEWKRWLKIKLERPARSRSGPEGYVKDSEF